MPTVPGWPSPLFPTQSRAVGVEDAPFSLVNSYLVPIPAPGQQGVISGASYSFEYKGNALRMILLILDIPVDVTATVSVDGNPILGVSDAKGLSIALPYGSLEARTATRVAKITLAGVNNGTAVRDVRAWAVCVP